MKKREKQLKELEDLLDKFGNESYRDGQLQNETRQAVKNWVFSELDKARIEGFREAFENAQI